MPIAGSLPRPQFLQRTGRIQRPAEPPCELWTPGGSQDTWPCPEDPASETPILSAIHPIHTQLWPDNTGSASTVTCCPVASWMVPWLPVNRVCRGLSTRSSVSTLGSPVARRQRERAPQEAGKWFQEHFCHRLTSCQHLHIPAGLQVF